MTRLVANLAILFAASGVLLIVISLIRNGGIS